MDNNARKGDKMRRYRVENWASKASGIIRERIILSDDFACAYEKVCAHVTTIVQGADYEKMKALGGFSNIIGDVIENLPSEYHEDRGSKMIQDSIAWALGDYAQDIRLEVQRRSVGKSPRGFYYNGAFRPIISMIGEYAPRECSKCGQVDVDICCDGATHVDGSHSDYSYCRNCCACNTRPVFRSDRYYYPQD